jgi:uncharacterized protein YggE
MWTHPKENPVGSALISVLLAMLTLFVGLKAWNTALEHRYIGKPTTVRDTITIEGEGKVNAKPDLGLVNLGVYLEGTDLAMLQRQHTLKVNAINAALKEIGIADKDIQTSNYSISPKMDYKDGASKIVGYAISQSVSVKIRNLEKIGDVLAKAGPLGANQVGGVSFTIDEPSELKQQAREKALSDAKKKAEALASQLDVGLGHVVSFSESSGGGNIPMYRTMATDAVMAPAAAPAPDIQAGSLDVVSNVSVTFEIH